MSETLLVLTARFNSERLPGKVIAPVRGKTVLEWIAKRLESAGKLVVATTGQPDDDKIEAVAKQAGLVCYRHDGDPNDVVGRMDAVWKRYGRSPYIMRVLGDCPFVEVELIQRAQEVLKQEQADLFLWHAPPFTLPVYGAREFPMSAKAWALLAAHAQKDEREHPDLWINRNRYRLKIVYHQTPNESYFRHPNRIRVELDWPEDLRVIRAIAAGPGMLAKLETIIRWLDKNEHVAQINRSLVERTGPAVSYDHALQRKWFSQMVKAPMYTWNNEQIQPGGGVPIHCAHCGTLLGHGLHGRLYSANGDVMTEGVKVCSNCSGRRSWHRPL